MKILIATITAGGGHLQAAAALEEAWGSMRPGDVVEKVDALTFFSRIHRKLYTDGYIKMVEHAPEVWGLVFKKTDNPGFVRKLAKFRQAFPPASTLKFIKHLKEFKPDVVLCTHYLPVEILGKAREKWEGKFPFVVSVVTDFEAHALWMGEAASLYCVAAEETRAGLLARGAQAEQVVATGIPISAKFSSTPDAAALRKRLGLRDDLPTLLVLGGGFGMGPVAEILSQLNHVTHDFQTIVVAGRNEELRRELSVMNHKHPTHVYGFVTNMNELMTLSDLIISKPGGLTTSEALAVGRPLFILNPIPGQEAANSDFLLQHGAAEKATRVEDLPFRIGKLLGSKKLKDMARAAKALGRPDSAREVCRNVLERIG
jgi:processive 1,2-diacylglycerol beta-glucosyltransferase